MVSMVLGLIIIGAAISAIVANGQSNRTNEALSQVQESARTAFELLARGIREAGVTGCDSNSGKVTSALTPRSLWWQDWFGLRGFEGMQADRAVELGTGIGQRVAGTDSLQLQGIQGNGVSIVRHQPGDNYFQLNDDSTDLTANDILVVCDFDHATVFQSLSYDQASAMLAYQAGGTSPGNCSAGLGFPMSCTTPGNIHSFNPNSQLARLAVVDWFIGNNGRTAEGGRSLYRYRMSAGGEFVTEEVVAGVVDMQLTYRLDDGSQFVPADSPQLTNWNNVNAVMIALTLQSADRRVTTDNTVNSGRLERRFTDIITLRNRVQ
jgi:type IV pilus assembly protein PilW